MSAADAREVTRVNKRKLQGERSREEILDAASRMMSVQGYEGTSLADIARESGLPNSSIYWHFNSKAGILAAVMERGARRFFADTELAGERGDRAPEEHLRWALHRASAAMQEHGEFLRLLIILLLNSGGPETAEVVDRVRAEGRARLRDVVRAAFLGHGEEAASLVADRLVDYALAAFDGAFLATQAQPGLSHEALMDQLAASLAGLGSAVLAGAGR